jgi:hypothetical protein
MAVLVSDSLRDAKEAAKQWRRAKVAGELVLVRRFKRRIKAAGAGVEIHVVVVALRAPKTRGAS